MFAKDSILDVWLGSECMQVESKSLTKRFMIFILRLLINTVLPLTGKPPAPAPGAYLISKL